MTDPQAFCWRDWRRKCIHGGARALKCITADPGENYCQEALKQWPNIAKQMGFSPKTARQYAQLVEGCKG